MIVRYPVYTWFMGDEACLNLQGAFTTPSLEFPTLVIGNGEYVLATVDPGPGNGCVAYIGPCTVPNGAFTFDIGSIV